MAEPITAPRPTQETTASGAAHYRRFTQEEYFQMVEAGILDAEDHTELLHGYITEVTAQNAPHRAAVGKVSQTFNLKLAEKNYWAQIQSTLPLDDRNVPEPDVAVLSGAPDDLLDGEPDEIPLVVEVADTSLETDRTAKLACYAENEIPEYWIVNLQDRTLEVYRDPAHGEYRERRTFNPGDTVTPRFDEACTIEVNELLPHSG